MDDEPQPDRCLLQFRPAAPEPARVLKETWRTAVHGHGHARDLPPPPTPVERAEAERRARLAQETAERERRLARERREWGGRLPGDVLRTVGGNGSGLRDFGPGLLHALDAAGPATQRAVAVPAARRACEAAGLTALDRVTEALTAPDEGRPLPPPFDDDARMGHTLTLRPGLSGPDRRPGGPARAATLPGLVVAGHGRPVAPGGGNAGGGPREVRRTAAEPAAGPDPGRYRLFVGFGPPDPSPRISQPHAALTARDRRRPTGPAPGGRGRGVRRRRHLR
ncbi:hypothetical protein [Streptomyces iakyrus]|uniref:hypothetical protein n=1 Tax=Streptomyces iakyrus TaxID=68219 RepID=UPI003D8E030D